MAKKERDREKDRKKPKSFPKQKQKKQPGIEQEMSPRPEAEDRDYRGSGKLQDRVALITGGDSGIGRAAAILFAKEGADVAIVYLDEHEDAEETQRLVEEHGRRCLLIDGDIGDEEFCNEAVERTVDELGKLDILVNNAAVQFPKESIEEIETEDLERTFRTNIFAMFFLTRAAMRHLDEGSAIINTTSVTAYRGSEHLVDYASTKGAIVAFTRSLASQLAKRKIRVNAVAPGPIWTPLIVSSFDEDKIAEFGSNVPMGRAASLRKWRPATCSWRATTART